jgi:tetratricopeptide (TPR) repeat protein
MQTEAEIQARLQRMVARDRNGTNALRLLHRLVIFQGLFRGSGVVALAPHDMTGGQIKTAFASLRSWGFVQKSDHRRYWIEEPICQTLQPDPDSAQEHYAYYLHRQRTTRFSNWDVQLEWVNIHTALIWGLANVSDPEAVTSFLLAVERHLSPDERANILDRGYTIACQIVDTATQASKLGWVGFYAKQAKLYELGRKACERAIHLYRQRGEPGKCSHIQETLAELAEENLNYQLARTCYEEIIAYYNSITDSEAYQRLSSFHTSALISLGRVAGKQGDIYTAVDTLRQASHRLHHYGEWQQPVVLLSIAQNAHKIGQLDFARGLYGWALHMSQRTNHLKNQLDTLDLWGHLEQQAGNPTTAKTLWWLAILAAERRAGTLIEISSNIYLESLEALVDELREKYPMLTIE